MDVDRYRCKKGEGSENRKNRSVNTKSERGKGLRNYSVGAWDTDEQDALRNGIGKIAVADCVPMHSGK